MAHTAPARRLHVLAFGLLGMLSLLAPSMASAETHGKLDPLLRVRAQSLSGRSRVIVEFEPSTDGVLTSPGWTTCRQSAFITRM